jgi:hypothetical protein
MMDGAGRCAHFHYDFIVSPPLPDNISGIELWIAEYKVNGTSTFTEKNNKTEYEANSNNILTITYKKNLSDLSSVKHLEISYESSAGGGKLTEDFDSNHLLNQKTYTLKSSNIGGAIESKNEVINVNINLDGKIQKIELKNVQ